MKRVLTIEALVAAWLLGESHAGSTHAALPDLSYRGDWLYTLGQLPVGRLFDNTVPGDMPPTADDKDIQRRFGGYSRPAPGAVKSDQCGPSAPRRVILLLHTDIKVPEGIEQVLRDVSSLMVHTHSMAVYHLHNLKDPRQTQLRMRAYAIHGYREYVQANRYHTWGNEQAVRWVEQLRALEAALKLAPLEVSTPKRTKLPNGVEQIDYGLRRKYEFTDGQRVMRVPPWFAMGRFTAARILGLRNQELRASAIQQYGGVEKILTDFGKEHHRDETGVLFYITPGATSDGRGRRGRDNDATEWYVKVDNSTPEADGSIREYILRVDPNMRPITMTTRGGRDRTRLGETQERTAHNAVASTFGLTGEQYKLKQQS